LNELINLNLPYSDIKDTIYRAKNIYLQINYARILRGDINSTLQERTAARDALQFVDWKNLDYSSVISLTDNLLLIREKTFAIYDLLKLEEKKISDNLSNQTIDYYLMASDSFYAGRLNESQTYLDKFVSSYDLERGNKFLFKSLALEVKNFFYRYWIQICIFLVIASFFAYFTFLKLRIRWLSYHVRKLVTEKATLNDLIKKAQAERFKENKISALTYNIRTKSYNERLQEINSILPVLQARLKKLLKA
jgi:hypothetical protein